MLVPQDLSYPSVADAGVFGDFSDGHVGFGVCLADDFVAQGFMLGEVGPELFDVGVGFAQFARVVHACQCSGLDRRPPVCVGC